MKFTPPRIAFIYLVFAILWITTTDWLVAYFFRGDEVITQVQMFKGYFYVTATAFFLYLMVNNHEESLKREQELQRKILEVIPVMITVYRPDLSQFSVNNEFEDVTGWKNKEMASINLMDEVYPDKEYQEQVRDFMDKSKAGWKDIEMITKNGRKVQSTWTNIRLSDDTQVGIGLDISERKRIEKELKDSEQQYRLLFQQNPIPMFIYDPDSFKFKTINKAAIEKYGYSEEEFLDKTIFEICPPSEIEYVRKIVKDNLRSDRSKFTETTHLTREGKKLLVEISSSTIYYKGKKQRLVIANDITDQRKAEERAISAIIEGEERERQRIAKELHDGLGQYLSASNMNLKSVYEDLENIPDYLEKTFETGLDFLDHAISETRNISQNLMPKAIQDYGLELAAQSLVNHLQTTHDIKFHLYTNISDAEISDKKQINLYRILQEALNNAIRHAGASKVDIQIVYSDHEVLMTVEDNGKGFDTNNPNAEGIGIPSIRTRVGAMSANLDIVSSREKGTQISVVVPVN